MVLDLPLSKLFLTSLFLKKSILTLIPSPLCLAHNILNVTPIWDGSSGLRNSQSSSGPPAHTSLHLWAGCVLCVPALSPTSLSPGEPSFLLQESVHGPSALWTRPFPSSVPSAVSLPRPPHPLPSPSRTLHAFCEHLLCAGQYPWVAWELLAGRVSSYSSFDHHCAAPG